MKKSKETDLNLYYLNSKQNSKETIDDMMKRKKVKEREKRIKENKQRNKIDDFDVDTEMVIKMTNRNKMQKEQEKRRKLTREEQKRRKRNKKIKGILKFILLLGIVIGGIIFAMTSPIFNIKDIQVINNSQINSETIISVSGLQTGENIFKFNKSNIIKNIKENAYIQDLKIHRKIPNVIQIEVEERIPKYSVDYMGKYAYINSQGYILEISEDSKGLPIIQGITTEENEVVPGNRLNTEDLGKLETVIKIMDVAKENNLDSKVTSIDITNENEYSIYLEEEEKRVYLGDNTNLSNKMLYVLSIMEQEKGKAGDIYVNGDLNNKFRTYFRENITT